MLEFLVVFALPVGSLSQTETDFNKKSCFLQRKKYTGRNKNYT
jgi:hypothetical protein